MSRLIDADLLLSVMDDRFKEKKDIVPNNLAEGFMQMEKLIKEQPTVFVEDMLKQILHNQIALSRAITHGGIMREAISDKLIEETKGLLGEENGYDWFL